MDLIKPNYVITVENLNSSLLPEDLYMHAVEHPSSGLLGLTLVVETYFGITIIVSMHQSYLLSCDAKKLSNHVLGICVHNNEPIIFSRMTGYIMRSTNYKN